jgi:hypothetical protein
MNNTRRSVLLAMSVALVLPGCAPESEAVDAEGLDSRTVESTETQSNSSEVGYGAQPSDDAVAGGSDADAAAAGCAVFPASNWWNTDISSAAVDSRSAAYVATIGASTALHPDFGTQYGIPSVNVTSQIAKSKVTFDYASESDPGPYPIPANPPVENGSDAHILMLHTDECKLYELFDASKSGSQWHAGSGAIWDLTKSSTRPKGWTSADAAGLPIYPGLVRYEEVAAGVINHALRFTAPQTQHGYVAPASHFASSSYDTSRPPMGVRFRLKASFNISGYSASMKVILTALKKYGMFLADNGSSWYLSGSPSPSWNDSDINALKKVHGSDFEAIATGPITTN